MFVVFFKGDSLRKIVDNVCLGSVSLAVSVRKFGAERERELN